MFAAQLTTITDRCFAAQLTFGHNNMFDAQLTHRLNTSWPVFAAPLTN